MYDVTVLTKLPRRVRDIMTKSPKCVSPTTHLADAYSLMIEGHFRHLVVIENDKAVGIVSDRDVLRHMPPPLASEPAAVGRFVHSEVSGIMSHPPLTVTGDDAIENAVDMMLTEHISALVVTDEKGRAVGIVTLVDMARVAGDLIRSLPLV